MMDNFERVNSKAVAMLAPDIDTDIIAPLESLTTDKSVADVAFTALRYIDGDNVQRQPNPDFWLNQPENQGVKIILTGENFGCGSSREMAAQSFKDLGFRCLIGSSFGDIFYDNCFQQGLLVIILPIETINRLAAQVKVGTFQIDLNLKQLVSPQGDIISFEIDSWRRESLLKGLDSIELSLTHRDKIKDFQRLDKIQRPWVYHVQATM